MVAFFNILKKDRAGLFLSSWLFSHITVVSLGGASTPFLMVGIGPAVSILLGKTVYQWFTSGNRILAGATLAILIFGNLGMIARENHKGATLFSIQKEMTLRHETEAIDFTYLESQGKKFSVNSVTSPLWINIVWTYLYKWYGVKNYGYVAEWHGRDQVGQLDSLPRTSKDTNLYFLIIEPMDGIPVQFLDQTIQEEDAVSTLVKEKYFGQIRVQERLRK